MNKVLLITTSFEKFHQDKTLDNHYPLGISYIHSYLEQNKFPTEMLYLNSIDEEIAQKTIEEKLISFNPNIVCFQIMSHNRISTYKTIEYINKTYPDKKIIIGGIHTSIMFKQILEKYPFIYAAVLGDGEETVLEIAENKLNIEEIKGIAYYSDIEKKVIINEPRPLLKDLDKLPFPKHEMFIYKGKTMAGLLTSRGCPYKCHFCVLNPYAKKKVRYRSIQNVVDEIEYILFNFPSITNIWIHDDSFLSNNKRAISICEEIISRGIKTNFTCSARFKPISAELISWLEKAGFKHILFGLETGDKDMLEKICKNVKKNEIRKAYALFKNSSIKITSFLIVGLPGETEKTVQKTIDFVKELQSINYSYYDDIGILTPYPGTRVYETAKEKGMINDDYWLDENNLIPFYTAEHSYEKLNEFKERLRDSISLNRIFTSLKCLKLQKKLIPEIIRYSYKFNIPIINQMVSAACQNYSITKEDFMLAFFDTLVYPGKKEDEKRKICTFVYNKIKEIALNNEK